MRFANCDVQLPVCKPRRTVCKLGAGSGHVLQWADGIAQFANQVVQDTSSIMETAQHAEHKRLFLAGVEKHLASMNPEHQTSQFLTEEKFGRIQSVLEQWAEADGPARKALQKEPGNEQAYAWVKKYGLLTLGGASVLVLKPDTGKSKKEGEPDGSVPEAAPALEETVIVSHQGRAFEDLEALHLAGGHSKGRSLENAVQTKHGKTIPRWACALFTEACPSCVKKLPRKVPTAGHQPILTSGFGSRGQVDLIDLQANADGEFKFLLNYQDHGIKLYDNRALTSKRGAAIAFALLDIFTFIGAPAILQADNGREFSGAAGKDVKGAKYVNLDNVSRLLASAQICSPVCRLACPVCKLARPVCRLLHHNPF